MQKKKVWITSNERKEMPFDEMTDAHLQQAFESVNNREFDKFLLTKRLFKQIETLQQLKEWLQEEADKRKIKLQYPDEADSTNLRFGNYFWAERHNQEIPSLVRGTPEQG